MTEQLKDSNAPVSVILEGDDANSRTTFRNVDVNAPVVPKVDDSMEYILTYRWILLIYVGSVDLSSSLNICTKNSMIAKRSLTGQRQHSYRYSRRKIT